MVKTENRSDSFASLVKTAVILLTLGTALLLVRKVFAQGQGQLVCIDPGHGGNTGAYNATHDLWEDEINLDEAFQLKALLEANGYSAEMTRTTADANPSNNGRYTFCNSINADILVSIHTNSATNPDIDGSMMLYFQNDDKVLAQAIYDVMYPTLRDDPATNWTFTDYGLSKFASGVLMKSNMPAAMVESVIMSHDGEAQLLLDPSGARRQLIVQTIFQGIENYFAGNPGGGDGGGGGGKPCDNPPCKK